MGKILGLGSKRKWRAHHRAVERIDFAPALGRNCPRTRPRGLRHRRQHCNELVVVWRKYARHRAAQLRLHGCGVQMADAVRGEPDHVHRAGFAAAEIVEKFPGESLMASSRVSTNEASLLSAFAPVLITLRRGKPLWHRQAGLRRSLPSVR